MVVIVGLVAVVVVVAGDESGSKLEVEDVGVLTGIALSAWGE
jgi:hypothetical protein